MNDRSKITCPNCATAIDVSEVLYEQLQSELKSQFEQQYSKRQSELEALKKALAEKETVLEKNVEQKVAEQLAAEKAALQKQLKAQVEKENQLQLETLQQELSDKSEQVKQFHQLKAELEKQKREHEEQKHKLQADLERQLNATLSVERDKLRKEEADKAQLKLSEKDQIIEQLKLQAQEAQRKAEQGSVQLQGEVQELAIESWLRQQFPLDTIEEIGKGKKGADCLQIINTRNRLDVGRIYYESKRTKAFQPAWIEKFKTDMQNRQASVGVLVTETLPKDIKRIGQIDGVWVCQFHDLEGLISVLRESLVQISRALVVNQNKGDKMTLLYDYLTGNEFRVQIEAMVEGFVQMKDDLEREKRSIESLWKKREKQIEKVLFNANQFYSSIRGIAGNAIAEVSQFELPEQDD